MERTPALSTASSRSFLAHELFERHLRKDLRVEIGVLLRILPAGLLKLVVEFLPLALILSIVDFLFTHLGHRRLVAEELTAVGNRIANDESKQSHTDHDDEKHRLASDFL